MKNYWYNNHSEKQLLEIVQLDPNEFRYINPKILTDKIIIEAIRRGNYKIFRDIENPSEAVQLEAVKSDSYNIGYIENPSCDVQLQSVKTFPNSLIRIRGNLCKCVKEYFFDNYFIYLISSKKFCELIDNHIDERINQMLPERRKYYFTIPNILSCLTLTEDEQKYILDNMPKFIQYIKNPLPFIKLFLNN